jgi:hypothetical protein
LILDDLVVRLGVPLLREGNHHCREGWFQTDCPFCGLHSKRYHLGWNLRFNYVHCWKCGGHGLIETLMHLSDKPFQVIKPLVDQLDTANLEDYKKEEQTGHLQIPKGVTELKAAHKRYLKKRNLNPNEISRQWSIGGIGLHSKLSWRLFIPIQLDGEVVSWTTRSISNNGLRYVSAAASQEAVNHKRILYGEDFCQHAVIVHEGPFDVWRTGYGAVALCGTGYTRAQVLRIAKYPIRVICFDNEPEAQKRACQLCDMIEPFQGETYNVQLKAKDAAEADDKEIAELRRFLK